MMERERERERNNVKKLDKEVPGKLLILIKFFPTFQFFMHVVKFLILWKLYLLV